MSKYYRSHHRCGHNTDECYTLKLEIEALIKSRELKNYIDWIRWSGGTFGCEETTSLPHHLAHPKRKLQIIGDETGAQERRW